MTPGAAARRVCPLGVAALGVADSRRRAPPLLRRRCSWSSSPAPLACCAGGSGVLAAARSSAALSTAGVGAAALRDVRGVFASCRTEHQVGQQA